MNLWFCFSKNYGRQKASRDGDFDLWKSCFWPIYKPTSPKIYSFLGLLAQRSLFSIVRRSGKLLFKLLIRSISFFIFCAPLSSVVYRDRDLHICPLSGRTVNIDTVIFSVQSCIRLWILGRADPCISLILSLRRPPV